MWVRKEVQKTDTDRVASVTSEPCGLERQKAGVLLFMLITVTSEPCGLERVQSITVKSSSILVTSEPCGLERQ